SLRRLADDGRVRLRRGRRLRRWRLSGGHYRTRQAGGYYRERHGAHAVSPRVQVAGEYHDDRLARGLVHGSQPALHGVGVVLLDVIHAVDGDGEPRLIVACDELLLRQIPDREFEMLSRLAGQL